MANHSVETLFTKQNEFNFMEVHAHSHTADSDSHRGRKKWTHYFWEFLMLFLAVFCGFLAEYQLEQTIERHREKDYIVSMAEDLRADTANLSATINEFKKIESRLDSVVRGFDENITHYSESWTRSFVLSFRGGYADFYYTDRTIQQLKNAGGMRLIRNETAANGIIQYDAGMRDLEYEETFLSRAQQLYIDEVLKVWSIDKMYKNAGVTSWNNNKNMTVTKNHWITAEPVAFEHLFNKLAEFYDGIIRHRKDFSEVKTNAAHLIILLKKEYHLD
jgi:uncharacterized protein YukE